MNDLGQNSLLNTSPAVSAVVLLGLAVLYDVRTDLRNLVRGRNVVLAGIFSWFLLEAIAPSAELNRYPQAAYNYVVLCVLLSMISFLVVYHHSPGCPYFEPLAARFTLLERHYLLWRVVLVCAVVGFAPVLYYSGLQLVELFHGIMGMRQTWGGLIGRERYGGVRDALLMLEMFVIGVGPLAAIALLDRRSSLFQRGVCLLIAAWPLLRAYGSATRSALLAALIPTLAVLYFKSSRQTQRRMLALGLVGTPLVYTFMAAMVISRGTGNFQWQAAERATYVGNEMFRELLYITTNTPAAVDYQWGYSYWVQIVNPIPRFLWKGKPTLDAGILLARAKGMIDRRTGEVYLTNSPGLIGEMYLNFGLPGIIVLSGLGGWLVRGWDRVAMIHGRSLPVLIFYCMGLATLFIMGRSFNMNMFYGMGALTVGVWWITAGARRSLMLHNRPARAVLTAGG